MILRSYSASSFICIESFKYEDLNLCMLDYKDDFSPSPFQASLKLMGPGGI